MLNKRSLSFLLVLGVVLLAVAAATYFLTQTGDRKDSDITATLGSSQPGDFFDLSGNEVDFDDYSGRVRVINSWASWSPFSATELKNLNALAQTYADKDVVVMAVNRNEDAVRAQRFLDTLGSLEHLIVILDADDQFYERMDGKAMPETLFYNERGDLVHHARGEMSYEAMVTQLEAALATN